MQEPSSLIALPPEVLHSILSNVRRQDVPSTRLSCSLLARIGAEYLTQYFRLSYTHEGFKALREMSKHPVISKQIRALYVSVDCVNQNKTFDDWVEAFPPAQRLIEHDEARSFGSSDAQDESALQRAESLEALTEKDLQSRVRYDEVQGILAGVDRAHFHAFFHRCLNIETVALSFSCNSTRRTGDFLPDYRPTGFNAKGEYNALTVGVDVLVSLCEAARAPGTTLKRLSVLDIGAKLPVPSTTSFSQTRHALKHLHEFHLKIAEPPADLWTAAPIPDVDNSPWITSTGSHRRFYTWHTYPDTIDSLRLRFRVGCLRKLVNSMPSLRSLRIHLPFLGDGGWQEVQLSDVVGSFLWDKLRDFGLREFATTEETLVKFILRHPRLRRLSLSNIYLSAGTWESVFARIAGQLPRLRKCKLSGWLRSIDGRTLDFTQPEDRFERDTPTQIAVECYIRDGGQFPDIDYLETLPANVGPIFLGTDPDDVDDDYWDSEEYMARERPRNEPPPDEYDSDGSLVSYGSDDFDEHI